MGKRKTFITLEIAAIFAAIALLVVLDFGPDRPEIQKWANQNDYTIVSCEPTTYSDHGPFESISGKNVRFYKITVKAGSRTRVFYARFGFSFEVREND